MKDEEVKLLRAPGVCCVIMGVVEPENAKLPVQHFDQTRKTICDLIPLLLHSMRIPAVISGLEIWRDSRYHYLDVQLSRPEPGAQSPLFAEIELGVPLPADVGKALAAETRALLYKLLNNEPISLGALSRAAAAGQDSLELPVQVAQLVRSSPRSSLTLTTDGVRHDLDLGEADGVVAHPKPIKVCARLRAVGPRWTFVERMVVLSPAPDSRLPTSGWILSPKSLSPSLKKELEEACKEERKLTFHVRIWFHRVNRKVKEMQFAADLE